MTPKCHFRARFLLLSSFAAAMMNFKEKCLSKDVQATRADWDLFENEVRFVSIFQHEGKHNITYFKNALVTQLSTLYTFQSTQIPPSNIAAVHLR